MPRRVTALLTAVAAIALVALVFVGESRPAERRDSLAARLRCPVCQSESVRDSTSQTATDMQAVIDEQIAAGASDAEIIDFFIARYGEWVLLDPPARGRTLVLWALPLLVAVGGVGIIVSRRRRPDVAAAAAVVEEDRRDLARQVAMGEVDEDTASRLLDTYEAETTAAPPPPPPSSRGSRAIAGTAVLVVGIAAVAFAVVRATEDRPDGGYATGSILDNSDEGPRDLSSVSNEEMEGIVAANPDIVPMRLALARRYFDEGDFSAALPHYLHILEIEPDPEALANVGWMAYLNDRADIAVGYLEQSLSVSPGYTQAQFFLANVLLFGLDDPEGAAPLLREVIAAPGLPGDVRQEAESLLAQATAS